MKMTSYLLENDLNSVDTFTVNDNIFNTAIPKLFQARVILMAVKWQLLYNDLSRS